MGSHREVQSEIGEFDPRRPATLDEKIALLEEEVAAIYRAFVIVGEQIDDLRKEIEILGRR
jgi:hypothetical protein